MMQDNRYIRGMMRHTVLKIYLGFGDDEFFSKQYYLLQLHVRKSQLVMTLHDHLK